MDILENIEKIRKEKRVNQDVIAEQLGVKQPAYSNYINRSNDIWFNKLSQIANILGVRVIDIITYPEKYVPFTEQCANCKEKDKIIKNLNKYIETLERKINK
jgi:transcriptional regulator with XRE-family HTH domain